MKPSEYESALADEQAAEILFRKELQAKYVGRNAGIRAAVPNNWTNNVENTVSRTGIIIGRVRLIENSNEIDDHEIEADFYIADQAKARGEIVAYNWTNKVVAGCLFYQNHSSPHHELCERVAIRRTLFHKSGEINILDDQYEVPEENAPKFTKRRLQVPTPPKFLQKPFIAKVAKTTETTTAPEAANYIPSNPTGSLANTIDSAPEKPIELPEKAQAKTTPTLRAPKLMDRVLSAPKKSTMSSALATLQPDQYDFVTRPETQHMILQGHPGTGKTIIAVHRAAFLCRDETNDVDENLEYAPDTAKSKTRKLPVLLLGPTNEWVQHVQHAMAELIADSDSYQILSIHALLDELAGLKTWKSNHQDDQRISDVSVDVAQLVEAARDVVKTQYSTSRPTAAQVYEVITGGQLNDTHTVISGFAREFITRLPGTVEEFNEKADPRYRAFLAYLKLRTSSLTSRRHFGHIIIDEAQDIDPLEWEILGRLGNSGGWTIIGDLNQRRTLFTYESWDGPSALLGIEDENGEAPVSVLRVGYRSTAPIIRFADQLLPKSERQLQSVQAVGEAPRVERVTKVEEIYSRSIKEALALRSTKVAVGTVAIITVNADDCRKALRGRKFNLVTPDSGTTWNDGAGAEILKLMTPSQARGLEFDAVVVVEPAAFPDELGKMGVLYTSLTRANKFLTVIHHRALPKGMKKSVA